MARSLWRSLLQRVVGSELKESKFFNENLQCAEKIKKKLFLYHLSFLLRMKADFVRIVDTRTTKTED